MISFGPARLASNSALDPLFKGPSRLVHLPATPEEHGLVKEMVAARWRIQRLWTAETSLIDLEMIRQQPEVEKRFPGADSGILLGVSIRNLADESRCLSLISRYEARLSRIHERARRTLRELQKARTSQIAQAASAPPEPPPPVRTEPVMPPPPEAESSAQPAAGAPSPPNHRRINRRRPLYRHGRKWRNEPSRTTPLTAGITFDF